MFDDTGYGSDHYVYRDGVRYVAGYTRTLRPVGKEGNARFEERMDIMAQRLSAMADVRQFQPDIERRAGLAVEATVRVLYKEPQLSPIAQDDRLTGRAEARGSRGSGMLRLAPV